MPIIKINKFPVYGDKGPAVVKFQKLLQKTGSTIKANGVFTIGMVSAIKCFQKKSGIKVTGKLDKKTVDCLTSFKPIKTRKK